MNARESKFEEGGAFRQHKRGTFACEVQIIIDSFEKRNCGCDWPMHGCPTALSPSDPNRQFELFSMVVNY